MSEEASQGAELRPRNEVSASWRRVGPSQTAVEFAVIEVGRNTSHPITSVTSSPAAWCVVAVRYVGTASLTGTTVTVHLPMDEIFGCRVNTPGAGAVGLLYLTLEDSPGDASVLRVRRGGRC